MLYHFPLTGNGLLNPDFKEPLINAMAVETQSLQSKLQGGLRWQCPQPLASKQRPQGDCQGRSPKGLAAFTPSLYGAGMRPARPALRLSLKRP